MNGERYSGLKEVEAGLGTEGKCMVLLLFQGRLCYTYNQAGNERREYP